MKLAWGQKVNTQFAVSVIALCNRLGIDEPSWLMACMAFETGETFSPSIRNGAGSGAIGLIQFMPSTATALGTSVEALATMTAIDQLVYVERYFQYQKGKLHSLGDVYGAILWPGMIGKPDSFVLFDKFNSDHPLRYAQNKGLDFNDDGLITRGEVTTKIKAKLDKGMTLSKDIPYETFV